MYTHFPLQNSKYVICSSSNMHVIVILSESALTSVQAMMSIMLHEKSTKKGFEKYLKTEYECHT